MSRTKSVDLTWPPNSPESELNSVAHLWDVLDKWTRRTLSTVNI